MPRRPVRSSGRCDRIFTAECNKRISKVVISAPAKIPIAYPAPVLNGGYHILCLENPGLFAKIAGGARMFEVSGLSDVGNIGARNAEAAKAKLKQLGIRLVAEDTGLNYGRTVELHCDTGEFYIKSVGKPLKII